MALQLLSDDLGVIDHPLTVGGLALGTRTTVIRRADGSVALVSPGPLGDEDAAAIAALGPVRAIVAPNLLHHRYLAAALARFAEGRLYAPAALAKKEPALRIEGAPGRALVHAHLHALQRRLRSLRPDAHLPLDVQGSRSGPRRDALRQGF